MNKFAAITGIAVAASTVITHRRMNNLVKNMRKDTPKVEKTVDLNEAIRDVQRLTKAFSD